MPITQCTSEWYFSWVSWHMVLDPTAPTKASLSVGRCQIVEGGYEWKTSYSAILLTHRTIIWTSGQPPSWHTLGTSSSGPAAPEETVEQNLAHSLPGYLCLGPTILFPVWKIIPPPSCRSQKEFISSKTGFRRCCFSGLDKSSLITFIVSLSPLTQQSGL